MRGDTLVFLKLTRISSSFRALTNSLPSFRPRNFVKADLWTQKRSVASFSSLLFLLLTFSIFLFPALKTLSFLLPATLHKTMESRVSSGRKLEWGKYPVQTRNLHDILFLNFGFERLSYFYFWFLRPDSYTNRSTHTHTPTRRGVGVERRKREQAVSSSTGSGGRRREEMVAFSSTDNP